MDATPQIILYEPRLLLRNGVIAQTRKAGFQIISCVSLEQLTEEICIPAASPKVLLIGAGGLGDALSNVLRTLHFTRSLALKSVVYLPGSDTSLTRFVMAAGADRCIQEGELDTALLSLLRGPISRSEEQEKLSISEINVLLDYASGMQTREIASRRNCSYKTVFTFKRTARIRLQVESKPGWLNLMTHIVQLASANR